MELLSEIQNRLVTSDAEQKNHVVQKEEQKLPVLEALHHNMRNLLLINTVTTLRDTSLNTAHAALAVYPTVR